MMLTALALLQISAKPAPPRFERASPLVGAPSIMIDAFQNGVGVAGQLARANGLQARIMWVDLTANLDRVNSIEKVEDTVAHIAEAGFNTIVFDVKPLSGQVAYPSKFAPKIKTWRGKNLPEDFDALRAMVDAAKRRGLAFYTALNAFSEGHGLLKVGPGYEHPDEQTVLYETENYVRIGNSAAPLAAKADQTAPNVINVETVAQPVLSGSDRVFLNVQGQVVASSAMAKGGVALVGRGPLATWLQEHAKVGRTVAFETKPIFVPISARPEQQYPLMMNLNHPKVREYELGIAEEIVRNYPVDGIIYDDRLRYGGINADFSEITRRKFEGWLGRKVQWPDDVFRFTIGQTLKRGLQPGPEYDAWMQFRAACITEYVDQVRHTIKSVRPNAQLGVYAGSWYGEYPALGNNWASPDVESGFWFATPWYRKTGFAERLDFLVTGCYYPVATTYDAMSKGAPIGSTVEAAGILTNRMVQDRTWCYAGIALSDFKGNPAGLMNALQAACASTQGVMVFDLSHDVEPMWPVFRQAFTQRRVPPHRRPDVLATVRRRIVGARTLPVPFAAGSAGTGQ